MIESKPCIYNYRIFSVLVFFVEPIKLCRIVYGHIDQVINEYLTVKHNPRLNESLDIE